jgi:TolB-like protein/AraC-like DNA-binding protein/Tfp pilus assembly protein PilF
MNDQSSIDHAFTRKLTEIIRANLENENFGIKELVRETGMSRFNLNRKLQFISRKTINQFIREVRLQKAMEMLLQESVTASEVAFKVGFSSPAYFSTCFSEYFGYPPGEVKKRGLNSPAENGEGFSVEPVTIKQESVQTGTKPPGWNRQVRRVIVFVSFSILFIIVIIYFFNPKTFGNLNFKTDNRLKNQKKSIAVLPLINDSRDQENVYFINGVMEAILDNLSKIKDLEVRPRTSVEQYRNNGTKTIPQIARELGVNYIIEGSGQKIGDQVSLYIQLIETSSNKHLFSNRYNMKLEDIFNLQSEVAIKVASEIKAVITIEEKESIEKTHTTNFGALNLFLQANDVHNIAESEGKWELDIKAERLYKRAIRLDSTYADPYASLGWIISNRNIDSAFYLANRALHFDAKNAEAYTLKGFVYYNKGMEKEAEQAYKQSIKYKPNNSSAFRYLGELYFYQGNCSSAIEYQLQAFHLENNSTKEQDNIESFCLSLYSLGFYKEGEKYAARLLELNNDSSYYYMSLASADLDLGNYKSALKSSLKMYASDRNKLSNIYELLFTYLYLRDFREAYLLLQKYIEIMNQQGRNIEPDYLFGFVYLQNGRKEKADFHFEGTIKEMLKIIELNEPSVTGAYLVLAKIYSARDEKAKALEYLKKVNESMGSVILRTQDSKNCAMFDNIRQEPEFIEFLKNTEARYQEEHNKVEKLLRAEGILDSSGK